MEFKGEAPRLTPDQLPDGMSQSAVNARLLSGALEAWQDFVATHSGDTSAPVSIYLLAESYWLEWAASALGAYATEVDVAQCAVAGDTSNRVIFCGTDAPRFTDIGLATGLVDGSGNPITGSSTPGPATTGLPVYSRKLGVPNPGSNDPIVLATTSSETTIEAQLGYYQPTTFVSVDTNAAGSPVSITDTFDGGANNGWTLSTNTGTPFTNFSEAQIIATGGDAGTGNGCLDLQSNNANASAMRQFGVETSAAITFQVDFNVISLPNYDYAFGFHCGRDAADLEGVLFYWDFQSPGYSWWKANYSSSLVLSSGNFGGSIEFPLNTWLTFKCTITPSGSAVADYSFQVFNGATLLASFTLSGYPIVGNNFGFNAYGGGNNGNSGVLHVQYDNVQINASSTGSTENPPVAVSYVYTLSNDLGQESGPSSPSYPPITRSDGTAVTVGLPTTLDWGQFTGGLHVEPTAANPAIGPTTATGGGGGYAGVDPTYFEIGTYTPIALLKINLYRTVTTDNGTSFLFVTSQPFGTAFYVDSLEDAALSNALNTSDWAPPPTNMQGILALPNGIYAGFFGNQLALSAQGVQHSYPVSYRLTFDTAVVAIGNVDTMVVVATKSFPYIAYGTTPDSYSESKIEAPHPCQSKRSLAYLRGVGVAYSTADGLVAIAGPGRANLVTQGLFTDREWKALNPSSHISAVKDDRYFCWYQTSNASGGTTTPTVLQSTDQVVNQTYGGVYTAQLILNGVQSGSTIVVGFAGASLVQSVADGQGTYQAAALDGALGVSADVGIFVLTGAVAGTHTITLTSQPADGPTIAAVAYEVTASTVQDVGTSVQLQSVAANAVFDGAITTTGNNRLVIGFVASEINFTQPLALAPLTLAPNPSSEVYPSVAMAWVAEASAGAVTLPFQNNSLVAVDDFSFVAISLGSGGVTKGGFVLDLREAGAGKMSLAFHATARYDDPQADKLYVVMDYNTPPFSPAGYTPVAADNQTIYQFDANASQRLPYAWTSKEFQGRPVAYLLAQVRAYDYSACQLQVYADGVLYSTTTVTGPEFTLPQPVSGVAQRYAHLTLSGTSKVSQVILAEGADELQ
jgi:hypothetical protein